MHYIPITPFRRTVTAALMEHQKPTEGDLGLEAVDKWHVFRELTTGRAAFGLSHRDLAVLQALLSFHPTRDLDPGAGDLIVFPSNKSICGRLNGMPCSTMRRHLAKLVDSGLITRRDSPNGKRYRRRYGPIQASYGFDLTPLVVRGAEITKAAKQAQAEGERIKYLREQISLMRRDLTALVDHCRKAKTQKMDLAAVENLIDQVSRTLRRKLTVDKLEAIHSELEVILSETRAARSPVETTEMSTSDVHSEQHIQSSDINRSEKESERIDDQVVVFEDARGKPVTRKSDRTTDERSSVPMALLLSSCREIAAFAENGIRSMNDLVRAAERSVPMMGISGDAWMQAKSVMGAGEASVVIAAMLERFEEIKSPGAYLRSLCIRAGNGEFSCVPMVKALARRRAA